MVWQAVLLDAQDVVGRANTGSRNLWMTPKLARQAQEAAQQSRRRPAR